MYTHADIFQQNTKKINYGYKDNNYCRSCGAGNFHSM